jgi:hypothetical protein
MAVLRPALTAIVVELGGRFTNKNGSRGCRCLLELEDLRAI